jgi:hypothetical protein
MITVNIIANIITTAVSGFLSKIITTNGDKNIIP